MKKTKTTTRLSRITFRWIGLHLSSEYKRSEDTNTKSDEGKNTKTDTAQGEIFREGTKVRNGTEHVGAENSSVIMTAERTYNGLKLMAIQVLHKRTS